MSYIFLPILYYIIVTLGFYLVIVAFQYLRFSLADFSNQGRTKLVLLFFQITSLSISLSTFFNEPFVMEHQYKVIMGHYLKINPSINIGIGVSLLFYLLSAFGFQNESPKTMRKATIIRVILSMTILSLLFLLFTVAMVFSPDFYRAVYEINPSDSAGFIAFAIVAALLSIYSISGLKPNEKHKRLTITLSVAMAIVHIIIVYCIYIQKIPQSKLDTYFIKLGGFG